MPNHVLFNGSKINVHETSGYGAINVFEASNSGSCPIGAILVNSGSNYVPGAWDIDIGSVPGSIGVSFVGNGDTPVPPGPEPSLPPYTIRLRFADGVTPTFSIGTGTIVDVENNIWDLTYENTDWSWLLNSQSNLLEVIDGNTSDVTNMESMFYGCTSLTSVPLFDTSNVTSMNGMFTNCTSLTSVPLFDTSNVTNMDSMFYGCTSLTSVPLFDTSNVTNMGYMFRNCYSLTSVPLFDTSNVTNMSRMFRDCTNVQTGALALYQQASTQTNPPTNHTQTFMSCGLGTQTGAEELAQIPSDWK